MINVRKLRVLQRKGEDMDRQKVVEKTRKYLQSVGDRIKEVAADEPQRRDIWKASIPSPFPSPILAIAVAAFPFVLSSHCRH